MEIVSQLKGLAESSRLAVDQTRGERERLDNHKEEETFENEGHGFIHSSLRPQNKGGDRREP